MDPIFTGRAGATLSNADQKAIGAACKKHSKQTNISNLEVKISTGTAIVDVNQLNGSIYCDVKRIEKVEAAKANPTPETKAADYSKWNKAKLVKELDDRGIIHKAATNNKMRADLLTASDKANG